MRVDFKLDENLGASIQRLFQGHGHDCLTVWDENLGGADDPDILQAAVKEGRVLVTMDHDFGNVLAYPPKNTRGVAVINPPGRVSMAMLRRLVEALLHAVAGRDIEGKLWIVEPGRIRQHEPTEPPGMEDPT